MKKKIISLDRHFLEHFSGQKGQFLEKNNLKVMKLKPGQLQYLCRMHRRFSGGWEIRLEFYRRSAHLKLNWRCSPEAERHLCTHL